MKVSQDAWTDENDLLLLKPYLDMLEKEVHN